MSKIFSEHGFAVINADEAARGIMRAGSVCVSMLAAAFGSDILDKNGEIDRRQLAKRAFADKKSTQMLNDITHPQIFLKTLKLCREHIDAGRNKIVFDAPVLFESNSDIMCDAVVSVLAPKQVRIERLMSRDGLPREDIERRISAQQTDDFYISRSDHIINGGLPLEDVRAQTVAVIGSLTSQR